MLAQELGTEPQLSNSRSGLETFFPGFCVGGVPPRANLWHPGIQQARCRKAYPRRICNGVCKLIRTQQLFHLGTTHEDQLDLLAHIKVARHRLLGTTCGKQICPLRSGASRRIHVAQILQLRYLQARLFAQLAFCSHSRHLTRLNPSGRKLQLPSVHRIAILPHQQQPCIRCTGTHYGQHTRKRLHTNNGIGATSRRRGQRALLHHISPQLNGFLASIRIWRKGSTHPHRHVVTPQPVSRRRQPLWSCSWPI